MSLLQLTVNSVRNISQAQIQPVNGLNVVYGANASGKTSLLESINLLSTARSFRTTKMSNVIQIGEKSLTVAGKVQKENGISAQLGVYREARTTRIRVNQETIKRGTDLVRFFPTQVITPTSHNLLEQGPRFRRHFVDWGVFHVKHNFNQVWHEYHRVLRQRNAAIRQGVPGIEIWEPILAEKGEELDRSRTEYLLQLGPVFQSFVHLMLDIEVDVEYQPGWNRDVGLAAALADGREQDAKRGFTQRGPHKMDLVFKNRNVLAQEVLSRGQQKMLIVALRLAQVAHLGEHTQERITVLVDDLPAELDRTYRGRLLSLLKKCRSQVFVTATEADLIDPRDWEQVRMFHVEQGSITEK